MKKYILLAFSIIKSAVLDYVYLEVADHLSNLPKDELLTYSAGLSNGELPI